MSEANQNERMVSLPPYEFDDDEFTELFGDSVESEKAAIEAMVDAGWAIGMTADGKNIWWPPTN